MIIGAAAQLELARARVGEGGDEIEGDALERRAEVALVRLEGEQAVGGQGLALASGAQPGVVDVERRGGQRRTVGAGGQEAMERGAHGADLRHERFVLIRWRHGRRLAWGYCAGASRPIPVARGRRDIILDGRGEAIVDRVDEIDAEPAAV